MSDLHAVRRTSLVRACSTGEFLASVDGEEVFFLDGGGSRLTIHNVASGSWPIAYVTTGNAQFLYFTYFMSSTLHKWSLDARNARVAGLHADIQEIADFLEATVAADHEGSPAGYLLRKLRDRVLDASDRSGTELFYALERAMAAAFVRQGRRQAVEFGEIDDMARGAGIPINRLLHYTEVPAGYDAPLSIASEGESIEISSRLDVTTGLNMSCLSQILKLAVEPLNSRLIQFGRVYRLSEFSNIHNEMVEIRVVFDKAGGGISNFDMCFSGELLESGLPHPHHLTRIGESLELLKHYISEVAEQQTIPTYLRLAFGDRGASGEDTVAFDRLKGSSCHLIPDLYVLQETRGGIFIPTLTLQEFRSRFMAKLPSLFWRGTTTGLEEGSGLADLINNHRVRACAFIRDNIGARADAKISQVIRITPDSLSAAEAYLDAQNLRASVVSEHAFSEYQMTLDLPGNAAAWGTYRKYLMGCLVIRPESDRELLYHQLQTPWLHYVPTAADLSDLPSIVDWVIGNPNHAATIAFNGRTLMIDYLNSIPTHTKAALKAAMKPFSQGHLPWRMDPYRPPAA